MRERARNEKAGKEKQLCGCCRQLWVSLSAEAVALGLPQEIGPFGPHTEELRTPSKHSKKSNPAWFRRPEGRLILRKELSRGLGNVVHDGFVL